MNDDDGRDVPDDPTRGFRSDLDATFAAAEPRIRARIAAAIEAAEGSRDDSGPTIVPLPPLTSPDRLPEYRREAKAPHRARRRAVAVAACAAVVAVVMLVGSPGGSTNGLEKAAGAAQASANRFDPTFPIEISNWTTERRGSAIVSRAVLVSVLPGGDTYGAHHAEHVIVGDPSRVTLAPMVSGPFPRGLFGGFELGEVADLPTKPDELTTVVSERAGAGPDSPETAAALASLAAIPEMPPDLRAAALRALGSLATTDPTAGTDPLGRPGSVVAGDGWAVIVDEHTGQVLAFAEGPTSENPSAPADADTWTVWLECPSHMDAANNLYLCGR